MLYAFSIQLLSAFLALLVSFSFSAPIEGNTTFPLTKRASALAQLWANIPASQKVAGDSAIGGPIQRDVENAWGTTYAYGCTVILISDPNGYAVAHFQQDAGPGLRCSNLNDPAAVASFIGAGSNPRPNSLRTATDLWDPSMDTRVHIFVNERDQGARGIGTIQNFLLNEWDISNQLNPANIIVTPYPAASGDGTPPPDSPAGRSVVRWLPNGPNGAGRIQVFFNREEPYRNQQY